MNNDNVIIILRDVICPKPKTWTEDYITACLPYCPVFDNHCWDKDQTPILDHRLTENTIRNQKSWGDFLRNDILGSEFNAAYKDGLNRGMSTLMNYPKEYGNTGPGYDWRTHTPTTRNDILELLKGDEMVDLARRENIVKVMGCIFKWGHRLM